MKSRHYGFISAADSGNEYKWSGGDVDVIGRVNPGFTESLVEPTIRKQVARRRSPSGMPEPTQKVQWKI